MRPFFVAIFLFAGISAAQSQGDSAAIVRLPMHQLKISLMDIFDPFSPSFMLSYEQPFGGQYSFMVEGGPVSSFGGSWANSDRIEGYKLRGELRFYIDMGDASDRFYLGLQGLYKHTVKPDLVGNFCRYNCAYSQEMEYSFVKNVVAGHLSLGVSFALGKHLVMDFGGFGGFRNINGRYDGIPDDATKISDFDNSITFDQEGQQFIPSIGAVFRLGFGW